MLSCMAILASVAVAAGAAPAGFASAEEQRHSGTRSEGSLLTQSSHNVGVYFHVGYGLALGKPTEIANRFSLPYAHFLDVGAKGAGYKFRMTRASAAATRSVMSVSWPILEGRTGWSDSGYRVVSTIKGETGSSGWEETCRIDDPRDLGGTYFHCNQVRRGLDFDWDLHITDDRVDRAAEASGAIRAVGPVSLSSGVTYSESKLQLIGSEAIPEHSSTQFDAVLTPSDKTSEPDTARMKFNYALNDGGQPVYSTKNGRPLHVRGYVANQRTRTRFDGGAWCEFVTSETEVEKDSGYTCELEWGNYANTGTKDGHVHYIVNFAVKKNE